MEWILLKCGQEKSIEEARKIRDKLEKRDKKWFNFFYIMQVIFIVILLVAMVLIFKYIGDKHTKAIKSRKTRNLYI